MGSGLGIISSSNKSVSPVTELIASERGMSDTLTTTLFSKSPMTLFLSNRFIPRDELENSLLACMSLRESSWFLRQWSSRNLIRDLCSASTGNSTHPLDLELNFACKRKKELKYQFVLFWKNDQSTIFKRYIFIIQFIFLFCFSNFD